MVKANPPADAMEEDDPFSLDFTKLTIDDEPEPPPPPPPPPPPVAAAPAPAAKPAAAKPAAPAKPAPAKAPPPSTKAPAAPAKPAPAAPPAAKKAAAALELMPVEAPPQGAPLLDIETPAPVPSAAAVAPSSFGQSPQDEEMELELPSSLFAEKPAAPKPPAKSAGQKLLEEVALRHAAGNSAEACNLLETALRGGKLGNETESGWSMLFDLLQALNRRQAFETLADHYAKRFEKSAPAWLESEDAEVGLETGGAAFVALNGTLSAASEPALKKLLTISETNPVVRLGLTKVTDADNDGCRLLLDTLRQFKKKKRECLIGGAEEFASMLAGKIEMMRREREETWLLLLELHQQAGKQELFEDMAVGYAVTFEVSPPSWETAAPAKAAAPAPAKRPVRDPFVLEGELLIGMGTVAALAAAAKGKDAITLETERLQRVDEPSAQALLAELKPLAGQGQHIRIRGTSVLIATLFSMIGLDKIATIEIRRR